MATLKDFEAALKTHGMTTALAILDGLRQSDRAQRRASPARRVTGRKMTPEVARHILELHGSTTMTQQEIAFKLGVNQGRVNEVIKRGKWLDGNPAAPEAKTRDKALAKAKRPRDVLVVRRRGAQVETARVETSTVPAVPQRGQLSFGGL